MRTIDCSGILVFTDGHKIDASIHILTNRPNKWFKARGTVSFGIDPSLSINKDHNWIIGTFYCTKYNHKKINHIYSLRAADSGSIKKDSSQKYDQIVIDVAVTRISDEGIDIARPSVKRIKE